MYPQDGTLDAQKLAQNAKSLHSICDVQYVHAGTAQETYEIMKIELASVGTPHWEQHADEVGSELASAATHKRGGSYNLALDKDITNVSSSKRGLAVLKGIPSVMLTIIWCTLYAVHLAVKGVLAIFDNWDFFSNDAGNKWPCTYFTGVSSIANAWRGKGIHVKVKQAASDLFPNNPAAFEACSRQPGRCLRGRWGSIDSVEAINIKAFRFLLVIFKSHLRKDWRAWTWTRRMWQTWRSWTTWQSCHSGC